MYVSLIEVLESKGCKRAMQVEECEWVDVEVR